MHNVRGQTPAVHSGLRSRTQCLRDEVVTFAGPRPVKGGGAALLFERRETAPHKTDPKGVVLALFIS